MVESQPSKLLVAGSIPVSRSSLRSGLRGPLCAADVRVAAAEAHVASEVRVEASKGVPRRRLAPPSGARHAAKGEPM